MCPAQGMISCTELIAMIAPALRAGRPCFGCARKRLTASRAHRNCPVRLMSITVFHSASDMSATAASFCTPEFDTMMSMRPNAFAAASNRWITSASCDTSACTAMPRPPCLMMRATSSSAGAACEW